MSGLGTGRSSGIDTGNCYCILPGRLPGNVAGRCTGRSTALLSVPTYRSADVHLAARIAARTGVSGYVQMAGPRAGRLHGRRPGRIAGRSYERVTARRTVRVGQPILE